MREPGKASAPRGYAPLSFFAKAPFIYPEPEREVEATPGDLSELSSISGKGLTSKLVVTMKIA